MTRDRLHWLPVVCWIAFAVPVAGQSSAPVPQAPSMPQSAPAAPASSGQPESRPAPAEVPRDAEVRAAGVANLRVYRIGPEDVLDIMVWKNPDLSRTVVVRPDGRISLPLLNDIVAANLTPMELREQLSAGYAKYVNAAEVSVVVNEIHSFKVSVVGMVRASGRYELGSQATVLEALALAGGPTEFAKKDRIVVLRHDGKGWQRFGFDYTTAALFDAGQNFRLEPNDIVVVP